MCLILLALHAHPRYPLVLAANRDEWFNRAAAVSAFWEETPDLLAGRDLSAGGTWLGVTRQGRLAALTNVREPGRTRPDARSRGERVCAFLQSSVSSPDFQQHLQHTDARYNGYNLLFGTLHPQGCTLFHHSNRAPAPQRLPHGLHGVSNHLLNTPWPKLTTGLAALGTLLTEADFLLDDALPLLNDRTPAPDGPLPDTGVGRDMERILSSRFILAPHLGYGTRTSTVLRLDRDGRIEWKEWTWDAEGHPCGAVRYGFELMV